MNTLATPVKKTKTNQPQLLDQLLALVKELNQDLYIVSHDKKTHKITQYSTKPGQFGLDQIKSQLKKQPERATVHAASKLPGRLNKLKDQRKSKKQIADTNESTADSKKQTVASVTELKSEVSPAHLDNSSDLD